MRKRHPPELKKFPAAKQRRLDELLDKNSEGTITAQERVRLEKLVEEAELLMVANAKKLAKFVDGDSKRPGAVPVTVWVQPQPAER